MKKKMTENIAKFREFHLDSMHVFHVFGDKGFSDYDIMTYLYIYYIKSSDTQRHVYTVYPKHHVTVYNRHRNWKCVSFFFPFYCAVGRRS